MKINYSYVFCFALLIILLVLLISFLTSKKENYGVYCYNIDTQASCDYYPEQPSNEYYCEDNWNDCQAALQSLYN